MQRSCLVHECIFSVRGRFSVFPVAKGFRVKLSAQGRNFAVKNLIFETITGEVVGDCDVCFEMFSFFFDFLPQYLCLFPCFTTLTFCTSVLLGFPLEDHRCAHSGCSHTCTDWKCPFRGRRRIDTKKTGLFYNGEAAVAGFPAPAREPASCSRDLLLHVASPSLFAVAASAALLALFCTQMVKIVYLQKAVFHVSRLV